MPYLLRRSVRSQIPSWRSHLIFTFDFSTKTLPVFPKFTQPIGPIHSYAANLTGILLTCVMQDELDTWNNISPGTSSLPALGGKTARRARKNTDLSFLPRNQHQQGDSSPAKRGQDSTRDAALWSRRRLSATGPRRSLHRDKKIQARALALVGRFLVGSGGDSTRSGPCAARPT